MRGGTGWFATGQDLLQRLQFGRIDPEPVRGFDQDLHHAVGAVEPVVRREPGSGIRGPLLLVRGAVDGNQVRAVVGESQRLGGGPMPGALAPGVSECDDVVDLDRATGPGPAFEMDEVTGVGVGKVPGEHDTRLRWVVGAVLEPVGEDVIAGIAAVAVDVGPGRPEEIAPVVGQVTRGDHRQCRQCPASRLQPRDGNRPRGHAAHPLPPPGHQGSQGKQQRADQESHQEAAQAWCGGHALRVRVGARFGGGDRGGGVDSATRPRLVAG